MNEMHKDLARIFVVMALLVAVALFSSIAAAADGGAWYGGLTLDTVAMWAAALIGAASLVAKAITKIARVTPNTKDDEWAGTLTRWTSWLQTILDRLALNPNKDEARR